MRTFALYLTFFLAVSPALSAAPEGSPRPPAVSPSPVPPSPSPAPAAAARAYGPQPMYKRHEVTVNADRVLGRADGIRDFFSAGGALYYATNNSDDPAVQAWRDLGFGLISFETLHLENAMERWVIVSAGPNGVEVDFTDYDRYLRSYLGNLAAKPFVYLGNIPRALSSCPQDDLYFACPPKDMALWANFVKQVVQRNVRKFGLKGLYYAVPGQPDHPDSWKGSLKEHVELYAATYRAVKTADPFAKVGGPSTMSWKKTEWTDEAPFYLEDWIAALAAYNAAQPPPDRADLDYISWQDYGWTGQGIRDGADAVSGYLKKYGFRPDIPKFLAGSGWGSWSSNYMEAGMPVWRRASHILENLAQEFKNPADRKIARAFYYSFYFNDAWLTPENTKEMELQRSTAMVVIPLQGRYRLTPAYAAFQMAKNMISGQVVETVAEEPFQAMAVWDESRESLVVTLTNTSNEKRVAEIKVNALPPGSPDRVWRMQSIDEFHSIDGWGLEEGFDFNPQIAPDSAFAAMLFRPYGSLQITFAKPPPPPSPEQPEVADSEALSQRVPQNDAASLPVIERKNQ